MAIGTQPRRHSFHERRWHKGVGERKGWTVVSSIHQKEIRPTYRQDRQCGFSLCKGFRLWFCSNYLYHGRGIVTLFRNRGLGELLCHTAACVECEFFFAKLVVVKGRLLKVDECTLNKLRLDYSQEYRYFGRNYCGRRGLG